VAIPAFRRYGQPPYTIVAVHGGPGGVGQAQPFASELGKKYGVVEPLLINESLDGQLQELYDAITTSAREPVLLVGHSYGAMLCYIFAAKFPELVKKLVMISSGMLTAETAHGITATRLARLSPTGQAELLRARDEYKTSIGVAKQKAFVQLFGLVQQADAYDLLPHSNDLVTVRPHLYDSVWEGMEALRNSGELAAFGKQIHCPVVAIHGDYDPRPAEGIKNVLNANVKDLQFILLNKCGHYPWYEAQARDIFFEMLNKSVDE